MNFSEETFDSLVSYWKNPDYHLNWNSIFVLPVWMKVWWQNLSPEARPSLIAVQEDKNVLGIAPLLINNNSASLVGSINVCDYLDFVTVPGGEKDFFNLIFELLKEKHIDNLDLGLLRPDSTVLNHLVPIVQSRSYGVSCQQEDVSLEMDLPANWDAYLETLDSKQRHEARRKLRRLSAEGKVEFRFISDRSEVPQAMDVFLRMFAESREDKNRFLNPQMEAFFRALADAMAEEGLLKIGVLELDNLPTAMVMCFDYNGTIYLYNSGYDPDYTELSAGIICKLLSIKESIAEHKKKYDFLKGNEPYKYQLGGKEVPLSRCNITIK